MLKSEKLIEKFISNDFRGATKKKTNLTLLWRQSLLTIVKKKSSNELGLMLKTNKLSISCLANGFSLSLPKDS